MAEFIVISADDRLHYLVDGIKKCHSLNPDVASFFTGKIIKTEKGYKYDYTISKLDSSKECADSFGNILLNQLAQIRLENCISEDVLVNIFFLENPLKKEDLDASAEWLSEFEEVHKKSSNFRLFRVIFTYSHEDPSNVSSPKETEVLKRLLEKHQEVVKANQGTTFDRYLIYMDNLKSDKAALCSDKKEHDLKMPRILLDFMMLVSNNNDTYTILNAINQVPTKCFSIGYAESMYYYPDVENYYCHADKRDIYHKILSSEDEKSEEKGKEAMDIETHPFGLRQRMKRLCEFYDDVPFTDDISKYGQSADKLIEDCIVALREQLENAIQKKKDDFEQSEEVRKLRKDINEDEDQIDQIQQEENETQEDFNKRKAQLCERKEENEKALEQLREEFNQTCPVYKSRSEIYDKWSMEKEEDKNKTLDDLSQCYKRLVDFASSPEFYDFVDESDKDQLGNVQNNGTSTPDENKQKKSSNKTGCLLAWLFLGKSEKPENHIPTSTESPMSLESTVETVQPAITYIRAIKKQLDLKESFRSFKDKVSFIESIYKNEKDYCDQFKLTTHKNLYFNLIDKDKLKAEHSRESDTRLNETISSWRSKDNSTKSTLIEEIEKEAKLYTKDNFFSIKWATLYSFVKPISANTNLPEICNELQKRAAPMVNYNTVDIIKTDKFNRYFFSNMPHFDKEVTNIKGKLVNGNSLMASMSEHIASKICMLQILPMDDNILQNLSDLQQPNTEGTELIVEDTRSLDADGSINVDGNHNTDDNNSQIIDWGEH